MLLLAVIAAPALAAGLVDVDYKALVSRSDLVYLRPASRRGHGHPIGNGVMGTQVWTTGHSLEFQINRVDLFAVNNETSGKYGDFEKVEGMDVCGACARISLDVGGPVFKGDGEFRQRLSLYDARDVIQANNVSAQVFVTSNRDLMVLQIDDRRDAPKPIRIKLHMWEPPVVQNGPHTASYVFRVAVKSPSVTRTFREGDYYCSGAVAIDAPGRSDAAMIENPDERSRILVLPPQSGKTTILVASGATWDESEDLQATLRKLLVENRDKSGEQLFAEHAGWWKDFWARTFVHATSDDGLADYIEALRCLALYNMAASSRGRLPPKFNGMIFNTNGDDRKWGAQFWIWNMELMYFPLFAADAIDLTEPYFNMYYEQLPNSRIAARQRWNSKGAFIGETTPFNGPRILPDKIAKEYRDVIFGRKSNTKLSEEARALGMYDSALKVFAHEGRRAKGRYTWVSHILSSGSEVAGQAWWRYRHTGDVAWLRKVAYPLLRDTVEFYRHYAEKGDDGKYHIYPTNVHEYFWGVRDGIMDLAAIRGNVPLAIRAAEILDVDEDLRAAWREFLNNLAPYPMGSDPDAQKLRSGVVAEDAWAAGHYVDVQGGHNGEQVWLTPVFQFEDYTLETEDDEMARIAERTYDVNLKRKHFLQGTFTGHWIRIPIIAARMGRADEMAPMLASSAKSCLYPNGYSLCGAPHSESPQPMCRTAMALQEALMQSLSPKPGEPEIIRIGPAWPKDWTATFRLLARGGFLVTSSIEGGEVKFVEITSRLGEECRVRNPWGGKVEVRREGEGARQLEGDIIKFATAGGAQYLLIPAGAPEPKTIAIKPEPATGPISFEHKMENGPVLKRTLGLEASQ